MSRGIDALVVNTVRRGPGMMTGMGYSDPNMGDSVLLDVADALTGGQVSQTQAQLDRLELALKISIGASVVSGLFALAALFSDRR